VSLKKTTESIALQFRQIRVSAPAMIDLPRVPDASRRISGSGSVWKSKSHQKRICFRVACNPSKIDAKRGDHFLQADFPKLTSFWVSL
jgi:hypothetical protein